MSFSQAVGTEHQRSLDAYPLFHLVEDKLRVFTRSSLVDRAKNNRDKERSIVHGLFLDQCHHVAVWISG